MRKLAAICLCTTAAHAQSLYVSEQGDGVTIVDAKTLAVTGHINPGGSEPRGIAITTDGKLLLTANKASGDLSVIDRVSAPPTLIPGDTSARPRKGGHAADSSGFPRLHLVATHMKVQGRPPSPAPACEMNASKTAARIPCPFEPLGPSSERGGAKCASTDCTASPSLFSWSSA